MHSRPASLRTQLAAAALAGLVITGAMTLLLLQTAGTAREAMITARGAHERVQSYSRLEYAAREFETSSFAAVRSESPQAALEFANNEKRYRAAMAGANALPRRDAREQAIGETVRRQANAVLAHYLNSAQIVREVDNRWRNEGSNAALVEVDRQGAPYFQLERTLEAEIRLADKQMAEATARALTMTQVAAPASLAGLVLAIGFSAVVFILLLTRLGPGLRRLEEGARAFGAGDLSQRIGLSGGDELAQLSAAFDSMAGQLAEKQAALQEIHAGLERAVAARTHELESANAALSAEDGRRRAFLADVSHELRTPLTIIRGEAQVALRMADSGKLDPIEVFERILQQTRDLSRMVDDLFVIARAEAGGLRLQRQDMDLAALAARVAADFETVASERGSTIRAEAGPPRARPLRSGPRAPGPRGPR